MCYVCHHFKKYFIILLDMVVYQRVTELAFYLYRALIFLGLALCLPSASVSSSFMVFYIVFFFAYTLYFTF